jgi:peptide deformylase
LADTLRSVSGVGITGPHIGVGQRVVVLLPPVVDEPRTYVNPAIHWRSDELAAHIEGSISMPGITEEVRRPAAVRLRFQDLDGAEHVEEATGFLAACHQHEIDQLDGVFWLQRLSRLKRDMAVKRYRKLSKGV